MVRNLKVAVLAGALAFGAAPAFAEDMGIPGLDKLGAGMSGMDLDPFHIFTPAPAPASEPMMKKPMMKKHMMMHKKMMMHHKKMMMHHKMMMKKPM